MNPLFKRKRKLPRATTAAIIRVISYQSGEKAEDIKPEHNLEDDLNLDSLDRVELIMMLEEEFQIEILDEEAQGIETVQQVVDYIKKVKNDG